MKGFLVLLALLAAVTHLVAVADGPPVSTGTTTRVSVSSAGVQANGQSYYASISGDGRYVAFQSRASNLVSNDTNDAYDIFVHDLTTRRTERVSITSDGRQADGDSGSPSVSTDGRRVAFASTASNLAPERTYQYQIDVHVHDRDNGETILVSRTASGLRGNAPSSYDLAISANGRFVAFASHASDLVPDDTNGRIDVFVHDVETGETTRVSVSSSGAQGNGDSQLCSISGDGSIVAFKSIATNLAPTEGHTEAFVHDRETGQTVALTGTYSTPHLSADGRYIAFLYYYWNGDQSVKLMLDMYDVTEHTWVSEIVATSIGDEAQGNPPCVSVASDGKYVAFCSDFSTLVEGDANGMRDVFVYHTVTREVVRVSQGHAGTESNGGSSYPAISADGRLVAFHSHSNNLVSGDTNAEQDIFVYDGTQYDHSLYLPVIYSGSPCTPDHVPVR